MKRLSESDEIQFIQSKLSPNILSTNIGSLSSWACKLAQKNMKSVPTWIITTLQEHSFTSWLVQYDYKYPRLLRGLTLGLNLLSIAYFVQLILVRSGISGSAGWMAGSAGAAIYCLVSPLTALVMRFVGSLESAWKYPGLAAEINKRAQFENALTPLAAKTMISELGITDDALKGTLGTFAAGLQVRPKVPLRGKPISDAASALMKMLPFRDPRSIAIASAAGTWFSWCASQLWSMPAAAEVVRATGWAYILIVFLCEPALIVLRSKWKFAAATTDFEKMIEAVSKSASLIVKVTELDVARQLAEKADDIMNVKSGDRASAVRMLYYVKELATRGAAVGAAEPQNKFNTIDDSVAVSVKALDINSILASGLDAVLKV